MRRFVLRTIGLSALLACGACPRERGPAQPRAVDEDGGTHVIMNVSEGLGQPGVHIERGPQGTQIQIGAARGVIPGERAHGEAPATE